MARFQEGNVPPAVLCILLHLHFSTEPLRACQTTEDALVFLNTMGLIKGLIGASVTSGWEITERGRAHVYQLCQHPFPVRMEGWMNPITKQALT